MRIRNFAAVPRPRSANVLDLASRRSITVPGGSSEPFDVELDLAIALETGEFALLVASPALLTLGLRPPGAVIIGSADPIRVVRLSVLPAAGPVELPAGAVIARLLLIETTTIDLFDDPMLDDTLEPETLTPYAQMFNPDRQSAYRPPEED